MKVLFVIVAVVATWFSLAAAHAYSDAEQELVTMNEKYDAAIMRGDGPALQGILAEEFIYTNPKCEVLNKQQHIAVLRKRELKLEDAKSTDVRVLIYGKTAVTTGNFTARAVVDGKPIMIDERYTAVWVRRAGDWQLVAEQGNLKK